MTVRASPTAPSRTARATDWIVRVLLTVAFVYAGGAKLAATSQEAALFDQIGLGQWFRVVTGALEVAGGLLVLIPRTAIYGAALLAAVMVGALATLALVLGGNPVPALVLLALACTVLWLRRSQFTR